MPKATAHLRNADGISRIRNVRAIQSYRQFSTLDQDAIAVILAGCFYKLVVSAQEAKMQLVHHEFDIHHFDAEETTG